MPARMVCCTVSGAGDLGRLGMGEPLRPISDVEFIVGGAPGDLDHPEGVTWGPDGFAYAGGEAGQIYRIDVEARTYEQIASLEGFVAGLCCDQDANIYACDIGAHKVMRIEAGGGAVSVLSTGTAEVPMVVPNYPCFHPSGDLYVSDSQTAGSSPAASSESGRRARR